MMELIKTITTDDVNKAFDDLEKSFNELAKIEDRQTALVADLQEYAEGSRKAEQAKKKVQDLQPKLATAQRAFRLAGMRADRVRLLLDVQKTSMGRD
jgi:hypothetical protein